MHISVATAVFISCAMGLSRAAPTALITRCPVANDTIPLPAGQQALTVPYGLKPIAVTLGVGTQNYTCNDAGNFTSIGAVADLYDISCYENAIPSSPVGSNVSISVDQVAKVLGYPPTLLGRHYFVKNPTGAPGSSPVFDFRADSQKDDPNAFVIASKIGDIVAPVDPSLNVDWLELKAIQDQGQLATNIFRIDTYGGQPPVSCIPGSPPITVPYNAKYWFFK